MRASPLYAQGVCASSRLVRGPLAEGLPCLLGPIEATQGKQKSFEVSFPPPSFGRFYPSDDEASVSSNRFKRVRQNQDPFEGFPRIRCGSRAMLRLKIPEKMSPSCSVFFP